MLHHKVLHAYSLLLINFQTFFSLWALKVSFQNLFLMCKYIILKLAHSWHVLICLCRLVFFLSYIIHLELIWSLIIFFIRVFFFQNFNVSFTQYHIIRFLTWELHIIILNLFYDISKVFLFWYHMMHDWFKEFFKFFI